jgi:transcriptional regulatory protein LevR
MADKTVYDSIIHRLKSGRDSRNEKDLREYFKEMLEKLDEQKMLKNEGKKWLHRRLPKEFELTSDMVNSTGKRHLDRMYRVHMRKKASALGGMIKKAGEKYA